MIVQILDNEVFYWRCNYENYLSFFKAIFRIWVIFRRPSQCVSMKDIAILLMHFCFSDYMKMSYTFSFMSLSNNFPPIKFTVKNEKCVPTPILRDRKTANCVIKLRFDIFRNNTSTHIYIYIFIISHIMVDYSKMSV